MNLFEDEKWTQAMTITCQPGDGTRYRFIVARKDEFNLWISSVEDTKFTGYVYSIQSVNEFIAHQNQMKDREVILEYFGSDKALRIHHFLEYMSEPEHSDCNPWTARAACLTMFHYLVHEPLK